MTTGKAKNKKIKMPKKNFTCKNFFFLSFCCNMAIMYILDHKFIATQWCKCSEHSVSKNRLLLWLTCLHQGYKCFTKYVCCFALFGFVLFYFFIVFLFDVDVFSSAMARSLLHDFSFLVFVFGLFIQSSVQESGKGNKN